MPSQDELRSTPYWDVENDSWSPGNNGVSSSDIGNYVSVAQTVSADAPTNLAWVFADNAELLDLSTPTIPTFVAGGTYAVTVTVQQATDAASDGLLQVLLSCGNGTGARATSPLALNAEAVLGAAVVCTLVTIVSAGDTLGVAALQESGDDVDLLIEQAVVVKL